MIHKPSYAPVLMAAGLMCALWGAVTTWLISALGLVAVVAASVRWIRDAGQAPRVSAIPSIAEAVTGATVKPEAARGFDLRTVSPWLHRLAILLAVGAFALVITGALVTSYDPKPVASLLLTHQIAGAAVSLLAIGLGIWLRGSYLGWALIVTVAIDAALGGRSVVVGTLHAFFGQLFFAGTAGLALATSRDWMNPAGRVPDSTRFSLRALSVFVLPLVVMQVALGAAYRHQAMGVMPHIIGALVVTLALLLLGVLVSNQYSEHRVLHPAAKVLIGITFTQVMLGMGAFITRLMMEAGTLPVVIIGVLHVTNGSLTLASTVVLTLLINRYLAAG